MSIKIHPNLVRRPQRIRETMKGKCAFYFPRGIGANDSVKIGSQVTILEFEHKGGKDRSIVTIRLPDGMETSVFFSDLAFLS